MMKLYGFKQQLIGCINNSKLTVEEVYYVMKDLLNEVTQNYNAQINQYHAITTAVEQEEESTEPIVEEDKKEEE